jgi:dihydropyrimidinase
MLLVHAEDPEICYTEIKKEIIDKDKDKNKKNNSILENNEDLVVSSVNQSIIGDSIKKEGSDFQNERKIDNNNNNNKIRKIKNGDKKQHNKEENKILVKEEKEEEEEKENNLLKLWSLCRPTQAEVKSIKKAAKLGRKYNSNIYFVHIGSSAAIDAIIHEKEQGKCNLYIETCPHYLTHTYDFKDLRGKVVPPLRSKYDVQSVWYALKNNIIDTIGTDHVANTLSLKLNPNGDLLESLSGFPGIATMLPVLLSEGVNKGRINLERVAEVTSYNTSRIFGLYPQKGSIEKDSDADLVIVNLNLTKKVTPDLLQSYSDYTIYDGWNLCGWPIATIVRGNVVMENFIVNEKFYGYGKFLPRFKH